MSMSSIVAQADTSTTAPAAGSRALWWRQITARYQNPDWRRSAWQIVNSFGPYIALWYLMYRSLAVSYLLTLALSVLAAGFMVRTFIIFHDCGHGSFFKSSRANTIVGILSGLVTFTPYFQWRHDHAIHHATAGDLDRRGVGDVWTVTVTEYQAMPLWKRLAYRAFRNPLFMFGFGPTISFVFAQRFPKNTDGPRERASIYWTDLALLGIVTALCLTMGWRAYWLIQTPVMVIGGAVGVWLFYVQHQFPGVRWEHHPLWDYTMAGMEGSSFYKLPKVLQWFTGNIGFHHIHHLNAKIPNYLLEKCHVENPPLQAVQPLTLLTSLRALRLRLWDEEHRTLVGYSRR
jgi:acyl-lipid omega-6 desaturase (Delta-12 desaturase)